VAVIPHTLENTTLGFRRIGEEVNVETDLIGKYVQRLLAREQPAGAITEEWLREKGY
jgi:riboflavin synthase